MPVVGGGEPFIQWWSSSDNTTLNYGSPIYTTGGVSAQPFVAVPVTPVPPPTDDSPLAWLRGQVSEVCELARAA